ncbi:MAG: transcriptional repressor [Opitutaceae bacterium]|nr:transcriptional repressor [Opitutaceae bacterium]
MIQPEHQTTLTEKLGQSGLRATRQRELIYGLLLEQRDHPTADEVYARAKQEMPSISLATVYNCLETLVGCHLVKQVNFERQPTRFCPNLHEHAHFHDEKTGRVYDIDLDDRTLAKLRTVLPEGFEPRAVEINFRGVAAPAKKRATRSATAAR